MRLGVFACLLVAACGEPVPDTLGDLYEDMSSALCVTYVDCGLFDSTVSQCSIELYNILCETEGVNCAAPVDASDVSRGEWNDCLDALATMSCTAADGGDLPRECMNF